MMTLSFPFLFLGFGLIVYNILVIEETKYRWRYLTIRKSSEILKK